MNSGRSLSFEEVVIKLENFCAYQERCSYEILEKVKSFNLTAEEGQKALKLLIQHKFVDDERFANSYASGKFRFKNWGRNKIKFELKIKRIPSDLITNAIYSLDEEEYEATVKELALKKWSEVKGKSIYEKKAKVYRFLQSKGFESELIARYTMFTEMD
ncbi:MAG: regulatory protein RecX [Bacteroidota bacterium]